MKLSISSSVTSVSVERSSRCALRQQLSEFSSFIPPSERRRFDIAMLPSSISPIRSIFLTDTLPSAPSVSEQPMRNILPSGAIPRMQSPNLITPLSVSSIYTKSSALAVEKSFTFFHSTSFPPLAGSSVIIAKLSYSSLSLSSSYC